MISHTLPSVRLLTITLLAIASFSLLIRLLSPAQIRSAGGSVVISEIQVAGPNGANDEFVELYNPTSSPVDLTGWRLRKAGPSATNLVLTMSGTIPAHGYFLVAHPTFDGTPEPDLLYTATSSGMTASSTLILYSDSGVTIVDKVGLGSATDFETFPAATPAADGSIERKASAESTQESLNIGGTEELNGNGEDSDNNGNDFVLRTIAQPQNSASPLEAPVPTPTIAPSPTNEPTHTPSPTLTPTVTTSPTEEPTPTPTVTNTPTQTPSPTPTNEPTPTPTTTPTDIPTPTATATPTQTPTPTSTVTPTPTSTNSPTPSPTPTRPGDMYFPGRLFSCILEYRPLRIFGLTVRLPKITCERNTLPR